MFRYSLEFNKLKGGCLGIGLSKLKGLKSRVRPLAWVNVGT